MQAIMWTRSTFHHIINDELIVKEQLESWMIDVKKKAELEQKLKKAFEKNSKTHTQSLSQM